MKKINHVAITLMVGLMTITTFSQTENCLDFDGYNEYIFIGDFIDLDTSDFTLESWIFIESTVGDGNKIINKGLTWVGTPSNAGYSLRASKTGIDELEFTVGPYDGATVRTIYNGIDTLTWYHVAGVRQGKNHLLYLDGVLVASETSDTVINVDTDIPLVIGAIHKGGILAMHEFMDGKIDEVRIWNKALSAIEIKEYKDCAITNPQPNLLAVYNLNQNSGLIALDSSGNNYNGFLMNDPIWTNSPVAPICYTDITDCYKKSNVNIFPNPFKSIIYVDADLNNSNFQILDMSGRLVKTGKLDDNKVNLEGLIRGSYIFEVLTENKIIRNRIMKE